MASRYPMPLWFFHLLKNRNPSTGRSDASGKYVLIYLYLGKGAIVGNHKVVITAGD
ncbi:hypothetical protein [Rubinisphaera italica]|uniref:hypothetical protein n=1 Tax=Rubinisphaera italica TaxID=2527969 RepID=UPI0013EF545F|nr:hypothetical protein [Rubinisphaera italica]